MCIAASQEERLLNKRPKNEGEKEVRLKGSSSCSTVLKEIIFAVAMSHATVNIKSFAHACMERSFFIFTVIGRSP